MSFLYDHYSNMYIHDKETFKSNVEKLPNAMLRDELMRVAESKGVEYPDMDFFLVEPQSIREAVYKLVENTNFSYVKEHHIAAGGFTFPAGIQILPGARNGHRMVGCPYTIFKHSSIAWLMGDDPTTLFYDGKYSNKRENDDDDDDWDDDEDEEDAKPNDKWWEDGVGCQEYGRAGCRQCWMNCWKSIEPFFKINTTK